MAKKGSSFLKRAKERQRAERGERKAEKRAQRTADRASAAANPVGEADGEEAEDPDIAGIVPGPQAPLEEFQDD